MADRYICIHGHFYQPPRENAWLEAVEVQDSAHPYHDWNQRVTAECYAANAYSRIQDDQGKITAIVNNYEKMSFNFGPTLLSWMEYHTPDVYQAILEADRNSMKRFSGHGSAMAQAYNHMILPLANSRDKYTQVLWGIRDFESRYDRDPEGMWLPETAVDVECLEIMAELGIDFTVLTPYQAARIRKIGEKEWRDVRGGEIDPKKTYVQKLPGGREIAIFFYDGPISRAVAFEDLLKNGEGFARRLADGFVDRDQDQLVHIATDGESYGHHSRFGDMALAYAMKFIEDEKLAILTNYGEYLEKHPPEIEVEIFENTSWSCFHGVERWRGDCGCGSEPGQNQQWRKPLREALDLLRDNVAPFFEKQMRSYFADPWKVRNDYIEIVRDRSLENVGTFLKSRAKKSIGPIDEVRILKLLEIQRHAMLMYTSCGWFFNELSRIETVQVVQYAGRILQLCSEMFDKDFEKAFLQKMEEAKSNIPALGDGKRIYESMVKPAVVDLKGIAAHYAISSLFEDYADETKLYSYHIRGDDRISAEAGTARLSAGRLEITSGITLESADLRFAVLYVGDHNLSCGVGEKRPDRDFDELGQFLSDRFDRAEFTEILRKLDRFFENSIYSLNSLLRDGKRKIINSILQSKVDDALRVYNQLYRQNVPLMRFLNGSSAPCPPALHYAGKLALNGSLKAEFGREILDHDNIQGLLNEADLAGIPLDADSLEYTLRKNLESKALWFDKRPEDLEFMKRIDDSIDLVYRLPFDVNLRTLQNIFYDVTRRKFAEYGRKARKGDKAAAGWTSTAERICEKLHIRMP